MASSDCCIYAIFLTSYKKQKNLPNLPERGVKRVLNVFPNQAMDKCTCVSEAEFIEKLDNYLREKVGNASNETYFRINEVTAMGLET